MIHELDTVVLTRDLPEHDLRVGDVGAVVHCYPDRSVYEVEFATAGGNTVAVLTLHTDEIRPMVKGEILHVRAMDAA